MRAQRLVPVLLVSTIAACYPTTTRPSFLPVTGAPTAELKLEVPQATRAVALQLDADSVPVRRTEPKDGWLESDWFDPRTMKSTTARPIGPNVVKVRAWIDPSQLAHSNVTIETVYRPLADPSRAPRTLERQVPPDFSIMLRMTHVFTQLVHQYGEPPVDTAAAAAAAAPLVKKIRGADTTGAVAPTFIKKMLRRPDTTTVRPPADTTVAHLPADTTKVHPPAAPPDTVHASRGR